MNKLRAALAFLTFASLLQPTFSLAAKNDTIPTVVARTAKRTEISHVLNYPATVEARVHATILAEADGVVRKIHGQLGQRVKAGGKLFTVQQTDPIFRFAPASTRTPISGMVSELAVTEGALVTKGQKLASVTDPDRLKITVEVPAQDLSVLQPGGTGELEIPALDQKIKITVLGISPAVDPATGTASAELAPEPGSKNLRPGMVGKVSFRAGMHQGFLLPEEALVQNQNQTFVRVIENGKSKKIPVKVGSRMRGNAEILEGLQEGQKVVERASGYLAEGDAVQVEEAKDSATAGKVQ